MKAITEQILKKIEEKDKKKISALEKEVSFTYHRSWNGQFLQSLSLCVTGAAGTSNFVALQEPLLGS